MESFAPVEAWKGFALFLNLVTFFLAFSAFSVGALIRDRLLRRLEPVPLAGVINWFLLGAGMVTLRALVIVLFHLGVLPATFAYPVADIVQVIVGLAVFRVYLTFERAIRDSRRP